MYNSTGRPALDDGTPNFPHMYMNFAVVDEAFDPSTQPNAHLSLCVTYYYNPDLPVSLSGPRCINAT